MFASAYPLAFASNPPVAQAILLSSAALSFDFYFNSISCPFHLLIYLRCKYHSPLLILLPQSKPLYLGDNIHRKIQRQAKRNGLAFERYVVDNGKIVSLERGCYVKLYFIIR